MKKILILLFVMILLLGGFVGLKLYGHRGNRLYYEATELGRITARYVRDHDGKLPSCLNDLVGPN